MGTIANGHAVTLIWVRGLRGPELQRWESHPNEVYQGYADGYWHSKQERIIAAVAIPVEDHALSLDELAAKYPVAV